MGGIFISPVWVLKLSPLGEHFSYVVQYIQIQLYRKGSHSLFDLKYHIVWITKYRKPVPTTKRGTRVRELILEICSSKSVQIIKGHVTIDHVHIFVFVPPQLSVSNLAQLLKGKTSRKLMQEDKSLSKMFWGKHLWSRRCFIVTSGTITDESIMQYIQNQDHDQEKRGAGFTVLDTAL